MRLAHNCSRMADAWSFFEAGHGKGAPDGVGGLLKRTAERLGSEGKDIPNAKQLYMIGC